MNNKMTYINNEKFNYHSYIDENILDFNILPKNIKISTISATCYLGVLFNLNNIYNYIKLKKNGICRIKYKSNERSLEEIKKKKKN